MKKIIIFFGPPGSGKGTQSDILGKKLKLPVISLGELLRHEEEKKTNLGLKVAANLAKGKLVSDKIIEKMLDKRMVKSDTVKGFILDGYPRRGDQLNSFKKRLTKIIKSGDLILSIYIDVSDREVKKRVSGRRVCDCGAAYHVVYNPPRKKDICDLCGKKITQREDDKPKVVRDRLIHFHKVMKPIINYFKNDYLFIEVNGEQSIKKIEKEIYKKVKDLISKNG